MSLDNITKITQQIWSTQRPDVVELAMSGLVQVDTQAQSGEAISAQSAALAQHFMNGSQANDADLLHQSLLWTVTEGRHAWPKYSTCADLCHCVLDLMGLRDTRMLNRDDKDFDGSIDADEAKSKWAISLNITKLINGAKIIGKEMGTQIWVPASPDLDHRPDVGDIIWIGGPAGGGYDHVFIAESWDGDMLTSIDAGQVDSGGQCIERRVREIINVSGMPWLRATMNGAPAAGLGQRGINGWISVAALYKAFTGQGWTVLA